MGSETIAYKLQNLHPSPSICLEANVHKSVHEALLAIIAAMRPMTFLAARDTILREPSASWFVEDRERRFGMSLDKLAEKSGGETAWRNAKPGLDALEVQLSNHKKDIGPFVLGSTVSYGDFLVAGVCKWFKKADVAMYERLIDSVAPLSEHHKACQPWLARDDH
jgi:glutathione S-transferase